MCIARLGRGVYVYRMITGQHQAVLLVRLPRDLHDVLVELARDDDRSLSSYVRVLLQRSVDEVLQRSEALLPRPVVE